MGGAGSSSCEPACAAIAGCTAFDCVSGCETHNPSCGAPFDAFLQCVAAQVMPGVCDMPDACVSPLLSWLDCEAWCIDEFGCFEGSDGTCGCMLDGACGPVFSYPMDVSIRGSTTV